MAEQMGISDESLQDLAACALLHDNALTQYIQEELHKDVWEKPSIKKTSLLFGSSYFYIRSFFTAQNYP